MDSLLRAFLINSSFMGEYKEDYRSKWDFLVDNSKLKFHLCIHKIERLSMVRGNSEFQ
jgi:hypothetical protein